MLRLWSGSSPSDPALPFETVLSPSPPSYQFHGRHSQSSSVPSIIYSNELSSATESTWSIVTPATVEAPSHWQNSPQVSRQKRKWWKIHRRFASEDNRMINNLPVPQIILDISRDPFIETTPRNPQESQTSYASRSCCDVTGPITHDQGSQEDYGDYSDSDSCFSDISVEALREDNFSTYTVSHEYSSPQLPTVRSKELCY